MYQFDFRESTISRDYERRLVEFYFTKKSNYETCIKRNPNYALSEELNPGYRLLYPFNQVRTPEYLLRTPQKLDPISLPLLQHITSRPLNGHIAIAKNNENLMKSY